MIFTEYPLINKTANDASLLMQVWVPNKFELNELVGAEALISVTPWYSG